MYNSLSKTHHRAAERHPQYEIPQC